ncbi:golvesin C-terminal-like domain-containing protein [Thiolapillus sp.]
MLEKTVNWTAATNRSSHAVYRVHHANGDTDVQVDQRVNGGRWMYLGYFELDAASRVSLGESADGYVIADAVRAIPGDLSPALAIWSLEGIRTGSYKLWGRWTEHANRAADAVYTVEQNGGITQQLTVDQRSNGGQWRYLGTFDFAPGSRITLNGLSSTGYVIADALRLEAVDSADDAFAWDAGVATPGYHDVLRALDLGLQSDLFRDL